MSRSGNVRFKSIHCWILCVLLAAALVFTGCGGTGNGSGNSVSGSGNAVSGSDSAVSGSNTADPVGNGADTPGAYGDTSNTDVAGSSTDFAVTSADAPDASGDSGSDSAADQLIGQDANSEQNEMPEVTGVTDETGSPGEDPWAGAVPEADQGVQEIVAKPAGRKSPLPEIYDPNPDYDKYALVEYSIDDIGAEFTATVSAEEDDSEYEVHCNLGKSEQIVILDVDYSVIYDRTGRMGSDAALIVQKAVEENDWRKIGE